MTKAEVLQHPGHLPRPRISSTEQDDLTVTHSRDQLHHVPERIDEPLTYSAAEVLKVALAAYERGRTDALIDAGRDRRNDPTEIDLIRRRRSAAEVAAAKAKAQSRYAGLGYPTGYDYRGGPVDWETGLPAGSACAWLRRQRSAQAYDLAGGDR